MGSTKKPISPAKEIFAIRGTARVDNSGVVEIIANIRTHTKKKRGAFANKNEKGLGSMMNTALPQSSLVPVAE